MNAGKGEQDAEGGCWAATWWLRKARTLPLVGAKESVSPAGANCLRPMP